MLYAKFNKNRNFKANPWGVKFWYFDGFSHRENGPAFQRFDGAKCWYLNGEFYTEEEFKAELVKRGLK